jgi:hypothetical protein
MDEQRRKKRSFYDTLTIDEILALDQAEQDCDAQETELFPYDAKLLCAEVRRNRERNANLRRVALSVLRRVGVDARDADDIDAYLELERRLEALDKKHG